MPRVSGFSVSGTSIFDSKIAPGAVMITAVRMCRASTPNAMYAAITPPGDVGHSRGHDGQQLRSVSRGR